jgi:transcriptional regulator with PAS, ATPase and Fis domain
MWEFEQLLIRKALEKFSGNQTKTAKYLGISRTALSRKIKKMQ